MLPFDRLPEQERIARLERLARKALAPYGMSDSILNVLSVRSVTLFLVRLSDRPDGWYVFRICPPGRGPETLQPELHWLTAISRDTSINVPEPVLTRDGDLVRIAAMEGIPGRRACSLFRWVGGSPLGIDCSSERMEQVGRVAALLHHHGRTLDTFPASTTTPLPKMDRIDPIVLRRCGLSSEIAMFERAAHRIRAGWFDRSQGSTTIIHGDLRLTNLLVEDQRVGVVGFSHCRRGWNIEDLATLLEPFHRGDPEDPRMDAALAGYGTIHPLPEGTREQIAGFLVQRTITGIADRLQARSYLPSDDPRIADDIDVIRRFADGG